MFLLAVGVIAIFVAATAVGLYYSNPTGTLSMEVKDSPISGVSHIYLTISNITLQGTGNLTTTFKTGQVTFDLLALINVTKTLGNVAIHPGNYTMIRFTIVSANVAIAGLNVSLTVPSGEIKVPIHFEIASGKTTVITLDIAVNQTEISTSYNLRPVVTGEVTGPS